MPSVYTMPCALISVYSSPIFRGFYPDEKPEIDFQTEGSAWEKRRTASLINRIARSSPFGRGLMEQAAEQGYSLSFECIYESSGFKASGYINDDDKKIILNPTFSDNVLVSALVYQSRFAEHFANGVNDRGLSFASGLKQLRLMGADALAASARVCFDFARAGDNGPLKKFEDRFPSVFSAYAKRADDNENEARMLAVIAYHDRMPQKSRFEYNDFMEALSCGKGLKFASERRREASSKELIKAVCRGGYFSAPPSVLDTRDRAGISETSAVWLDRHLLKCKEVGVKDKEIDPSLRNIPVYRCLGDVMGYFDYFPDFLNKQGYDRVRQIKMDRVRQFKEKQSPSAPVLLSRGSQKSR